MKKIMSEYGSIRLVDIPQCDPLRKQMDPEISGIRTSSWSGMMGEVRMTSALRNRMHAVDVPGAVL